MGILSDILSSQRLHTKQGLKDPALHDPFDQFTNYGVATNMEIARELGITFPDNSLVTDTNVTIAQATIVVNTYITRVTGAAATPLAPAAPVLNCTDAIFVFAGLAQTPVAAVAGAVVQPPDINQAVLQRGTDRETRQASEQPAKNLQGSRVYIDLSQY
ncbi:hypothetical protein BGZ67_000310 [Mortierella alpina]|nr:hypothetical protein BGZ67_000310 [Mortierella alpina]